MHRNRRLNRWTEHDRCLEWRYNLHLGHTSAHDARQEWLSFLAWVHPLDIHCRDDERYGRQLQIHLIQRPGFTMKIEHTSRQHIIQEQDGSPWVDRPCKRDLEYIRTIIRKVMIMYTYLELSDRQRDWPKNSFRDAQWYVTEIHTPRSPISASSPSSKISRSLTSAQASSVFAYRSSSYGRLNRMFSV